MLARSVPSSSSSDSSHCVTHLDALATDTPRVRLKPPTARE